jgi:hypothetical protein
VCIHHSSRGALKIRDNHSAGTTDRETSNASKLLPAAAR